MKQSGGFGPATDSRLETDRDPTHIRTRYNVRDDLRGGGTIMPESLVIGMVKRGTTMATVMGTGSDDPESREKCPATRSSVMTITIIDPCA